MFEKALTGSRRYWTLVGIFGFIFAVGVIAYLRQFIAGLVLTGLSRDVPWGLYIAQLTFLVGVAASAVMVVLPYYLHDYKAFGKLTILGEMIAIPSVIMCMTFVFVDMGQPSRVMNVALHPTLNSPMFWDFTVLMGYLALNLLIGYVTFTAEMNEVAPPKWIKPIILLSIPWAVSIHTVTAFLYSGLEARPFWMTAILAPRFLASAFAAGPSLLILLCLFLKTFTKFDAGKQAIGKLAQIVTYAMGINLFFVAVEMFTALYSDMPHHTDHFKYLFLGIHGKDALVPWMWTSQIMSIVVFAFLLQPAARSNNKWLGFLCVGVVVSLWIEKGLCLIVTGFIPSPLHHITEYAPTLNEVLITVGIYGLGLMILTFLVKIVITVREEKML